MYVHSHPCVHCISMKEERIKRMEIAVLCVLWELCVMFGDVGLPF